MFCHLFLNKTFSLNKKKLKIVCWDLVEAMAHVAAGSIFDEGSLGQCMAFLN